MQRTKWLLGVGSGEGGAPRRRDGLPRSGSFSKENFHFGVSEVPKSILASIFGGLFSKSFFGRFFHRFWSRFGVVLGAENAPKSFPNGVSGRWSFQGGETSKIDDSTALLKGFRLSRKLLFASKLSSGAFSRAM